MATNGESGETKQGLELAIKFLSNPKLIGLPDQRKVEFLESKGIDRNTIDEALKWVNAEQRTTSGKQVEKSPSGGFLSLLWKLLKYTTGIAITAGVIKVSF